MSFDGPSLVKLLSSQTFNVFIILKITHTFSKVCRVKGQIAELINIIICVNISKFFEDYVYSCCSDISSVI